MTTSYPEGYDSFPDPAASDTLSEPSHADLHTAINAAVEAVQVTLGTTPSGDYGDVKSRLDHHEDRLAPPPTPSSIKFAGHSYVDPKGVGIAGVDNLAYRLQEMFGLPDSKISNLAHSGATVKLNQNLGSAAGFLFASTLGVTTKPYLPDVGLGIIMYGTNDANQGISASAMSAFSHGMKTVINHMQAASVYDYTDATVSEGAGWTATTWQDLGELETPERPWAGGEGCWGSNITGSEITITVPADFEGGSIDLIGVGSIQGGTAAVEIDGVPHGNFVTSNTQQSGYGTRKLPVTYRIDGLSAGSHTVVLEVTAVSETGYFYFSGWQIKGNPEPVILVVGMPYIPEGGKANISGPWSGQTQATTDAYNAKLQEIVASYDTPSIRFVETDSHMGNQVEDALQFYANDGLHPNPRGGALLAGLIYDEYRKAFSSGEVKSGQIISRWRTSTTETEVLGRTFRGNGTPMVIVDDFDRDDSEDSLSGDGWATPVGTWGIQDNAAYVSNDFFTAYEFRDEFDRENNASSLGGGWTAVAGTWGIIDNAAYLVSSSGGINFAVQETSQTDYFIEFTTGAVVDQSVGIVFRYVNSTNYLELRIHPTFGVQFRKTVSGVTDIIASPGTFSSAVGSLFRVVVKGDKVYLFDGNKAGWLSAPYTITDGALLTGTKVGLIASSATTSSYRWNDFGWGEPGWPNAIDNIAVKEFEADYTVELEFDHSITFAGLILRYSDPLNYWHLSYASFFGVMALFKVEAGVRSTAAVVYIKGNSGNKIRVTMEGDRFTFYQGSSRTAGSVKATALPPPAILYFDSSFNNTSTWHGMGFRKNQIKDSGDAFGRIASFRGGKGYVDALDGDWYYDNLAGQFYGPFLDNVWNVEPPIDLGVTQTINTQANTEYTLVLTDQNKLIETTNGSAVSLIVPNNSTVPFPIGTHVDIVQYGDGQITVSGTGGVVVNASPGLKTRAQYSALTLIKRGTNEWYLVGDNSA